MSENQSNRQGPQVPPVISQWSRFFGSGKGEPELYPLIPDAYIELCRQINRKNSDEAKHDPFCAQGDIDLFSACRVCKVILSIFESTRSNPFSKAVDWTRNTAKNQKPPVVAYLIHEKHEVTSVTLDIYEIPPEGKVKEGSVPLPAHTYGEVEDWWMEVLMQPHANAEHHGRGYTWNRDTRRLEQGD